MKRGALVVLEGVDRCGKTSQSCKLIESLKERNVQAERLSFPDRTTNTGQIISKYLSDKECKLNDQAIHLLFSANRWENVEKMKEKIDKGITLIVDRYCYSGVAFSCVKGMDMKWCLQPEIGLPKPDLVILLDINQEMQNSRTGFGDERYETLAIQSKVSKIFKHFANTSENWKVIDANQSFDQVHSNLLECIMTKIQDVGESKVPLDFFSESNLNGINGVKI